MVKINKIYTRTGDKGSTHLVGGSVVEKDCDRIAAVGLLDEANSFIGVCRTEAALKNRSVIEQYLTAIQHDLFDLGAEIATPPEMGVSHLRLVNAQSIATLEAWIDQMIEGLPELTSFVLPGGTILNASLHVARTVVRRVERFLVTIQKNNTIRPEVLQYCNRLSDLLFAMARYESHCAAIPEYLWKKGAGT